jgi:hypothetical protein
MTEALAFFAGIIAYPLIRNFIRPRIERARARWDAARGGY